MNSNHNSDELNYEIYEFKQKNFIEESSFPEVGALLTIVKKCAIALGLTKPTRLR